MPAGPFGPQIQAIHAVEPMDALNVHRPTLPPQQDENAPTAILHPRLSNLPDALSQWCLAGPHRLISVRAAVKPERRTAAPLAHPEPVLNPVNDLPPPTRYFSFLVLILELTHFAQLRWAHAAIKLLPAVIGRLGHTHLAAKLGSWRANLGLTQRKRDLLTRELRLLHQQNPPSKSASILPEISPFSMDTFTGTGSGQRIAGGFIRRF
jgi:hypothetical protein